MLWQTVSPLLFCTTSLLVLSFSLPPFSGSIHRQKGSQTSELLIFLRISPLLFLAPLTLSHSLFISLFPHPLSLLLHRLSCVGPFVSQMTPLSAAAASLPAFGRALESCKNCCAHRKGAREHIEQVKGRGRRTTARKGH